MRWRESARTLSAWREKGEKEGVTYYDSLSVNNRVRIGKTAYLTSEKVEDH